MAVVDSKVGRVGLFLANPMVAKINKVEESGEPASTSGGIARKTIFLLLLTVVGLIISLYANNIFPTTYVQNIEGYDINLIEAGIVGGAALLGIIGTFISFKFVRSAFFFGSLYSLSQGYILAYVFRFFGNEYLYPCLIAVILTIAVVLAMLLLYRAKIIGNNKKFLSVIATLFTASILISLTVFILNAIPATKDFAKYILDNNVLVIGAGIIGIIISCLFLLVDFTVIDHSLEEKLPKKYEWLSAFALSFSILELYFKILNFVLRAMQKTEN